MRSTVFTATLLSLGALTTQAARAAGTPRVVLDTITGNQVDQIGRFCDDPMPFGDLCLPLASCVRGAASTGALGIVVHADVSMTISRLGTWFAPYEPSGDPLPEGTGFFTIAEVDMDADGATSTQIWNAATTWKNASSPTNTASVRLDDPIVTLQRGHDYIISYAAAGIIPDPGPVCSSYGSVATAPSTGLLTPTGYARMSFDLAQSNAAGTPIWLIEDPLIDSPLPSFSVEAIIGDTDGDGFTDDVDNCIDAPNRTQSDFDHDDVGDLCDNCPYTYNPEQGSCNAGTGGGGGGGLDDGSGSVPPPADDQELGCNAGGSSASLLVMLAALLVRRRRRTA